MTVVQALLLGLIQGLTEFLPVSSSGHLVIFQALLGIEQPGITFEVMVHFGSLLAILVVFREDIGKLARAAIRFPGLVIRGQGRRAMLEDGSLRLLLFLALGSVPAGLVGLLLRDGISSLFHSVSVAASMLLVTGALLWLSDRMHWGRHALSQIGPRHALVVGVAQALAIVPGISRSGTTITIGLASGLTRDAAGRFSFLLAVPAIAGATVLELGEVMSGAVTLPPFVLLAGTAAAAVSGYGAILVLLRFVRSGRLRFFAYYTWGMGLLMLLLSRS